MSIYIFIGPSLSVDDARKVLDAVYLPPVKMGDVFNLTQKNPTAIGIIDGFFENTAAVWHKEILHAMSLGIPVFGGGSMGALRAAELHTFGMIGVGKIFQDFADGVIEDDDEVAVVHAPGEDACITFSEAMVNIRAGLAQAIARGIICNTTSNTLLQAVKALFYPERSWAALYQLGKKLELPAHEMAALQAFVDTHKPNQKRDDALALLSRVAEMAQHPAPKPVKPWVFEHTLYWDTVKTYYSTHHAAGEDVSFERLRNHVRLVEPTREQLRQHALLLVLIEAEAQRLRLGVTDNRKALARFRYRRGLQSPDVFRAWMAQYQLDKDSCLELARLEMLQQIVEQRYIEKTDLQLTKTLKLGGLYPSVVARVNRKWDVVAAQGIDRLTEGDVGSVSEVLDWYQKHHGTINGQLDEHAAELGFGTKRQFLNELFAEYLCAQHSAAQE
jgi:hypothetical protein